MSLLLKVLAILDESVVTIWASMVGFHSYKSSAFCLYIYIYSTYQALSVDTAASKKNNYIYIYIYIGVL